MVKNNIRGEIGFTKINPYQIIVKKLDMQIKYRYEPAWVSATLYNYSKGNSPGYEYALFFKNRRWEMSFTAAKVVHHFELFSYVHYVYDIHTH